MVGLVALREKRLLDADDLGDLARIWSISFLPWAWLNEATNASSFMAPAATALRPAMSSATGPSTQERAESASFWKRSTWAGLSATRALTASMDLAKAVLPAS